MAQKDARRVSGALTLSLWVPPWAKGGALDAVHMRWGNESAADSRRPRNDLQYCPQCIHKHICGDTVVHQSYSIAVRSILCRYLAFEVISTVD